MLRGRLQRRPPARRLCPLCPGRGPAPGALPAGVGAFTGGATQTKGTPAPPPPPTALFAPRPRGAPPSPPATAAGEGSRLLRIPPSLPPLPGAGGEAAAGPTCFSGCHLAAATAVPPPRAGWSVPTVAPAEGCGARRCAPPRRWSPLRNAGRRLIVYVSIHRSLSLVT